MNINYLYRLTVTICMIIALWGSNCAIISLTAVRFKLLLSNIGDFGGLGSENCAWMAIVAAIIIPITWMGTPKDFW